jgi:hypothetical protein
MNASQLELALVDQVKAARLPSLADFAIEPLGAQVDLEDDQLNFAVPTLLVAQVGADLSYPGGDAIQVAFVAVVPGTDQTTRRQVALDALMALRYWLADETAYHPTNLRTERLHPVAVAGLFAHVIG